MSSHCLVTGAAGFIGSHLVDALLARGDTVLGIDNMKLGRRTNLRAALENPRFKFIEHDVNDVAGFAKIVGQASIDAPLDMA